MARSSRYSPEVRERAVQLVSEREREQDSLWAAILSIAHKIGCTPQTLRTWAWRVEVDTERRGSHFREAARSLTRPFP
jgi:transposase-like protein